MVAPVIPAINDHEIESIMEAGADAGAECAHYIFLRLPLEISQMFREWLDTHFPDRAEHVMSLVRQSRAGKDYESRFHTRMTANGVFADVIGRRFAVAARKFNLVAYDRFSLDTTQFKRSNEQLSLF
jgi:DNA repair photolyase